MRGGIAGSRRTGEKHLRKKRPKRHGRRENVVFVFGEMTIGIVKRFFIFGFRKNIGERKTGVKMNRTKYRGKWPCHQRQDRIRRHEARPRLMFSESEVRDGLNVSSLRQGRQKIKTNSKRPRSEERDAVNVFT
jgi:hypothetical protein